MKHLYFAITAKETSRQKIVYKKGVYNYKAVHTDLKALRDFIKEHFSDWRDFHYITVDELKELVDDNIINEDKNIVSVKLPFKLDLRYKHIRPLF